MRGFRRFFVSRLGDAFEMESNRRRQNGGSMGWRLGALRARKSS
jgi:hypothetical protein